MGKVLAVYNTEKDVRAGGILREIFKEYKNEQERDEIAVIEISPEELEEELKRSAGDKPEEKGSYERFFEYKAVILFSKITPGTEFVSAIFTYVTRGGSLLLIHEGLRMSTRHEILLLQGAKLEWTGPAGELDYWVDEKNEGWTGGERLYTVWDEPYYLDMDVCGGTQIFMKLTYGGMQYPAAWQRKWCRGTVTCLTPGITESSRELYRILIGYVLRSLVGREEKS